MSLGSKLAYVAVLPLFYPAHLMMKRGLRSSMAKARKAPRVTSMLARDETTAGVPTARQMDAPVELDYLEHRSAAYVRELVLDSAREAARAIAGENAAEVVSDSELARNFMGSPAAFITTRSRADDAWVLDCAFMRHDEWWNKDAFEVTRFVFEPHRDLYEIHDVHGHVHRPDDSTWIGARRKLIAQISLWTPLMGHAWAHFWLPDVIAATVHESLPRDTNLYRLLAPHTRFANRHNHAGLWIQRASNNAPTRSKRLVPWLTMPMRALTLRKAVTDSARSYHQKDHFTLPERFDRRIPYFAMLGSYFDTTEAFIDQLLPELEADVYTAWAKRVEEWYPGFTKVPMKRALAMLVWHMGIAHSADHQTYVSWARRYGTAEVDPSIDALSTKKPNTYDRYRFLAFLNNFADYRPPPTGLDLRLVTSDAAYRFPVGSAAERSAKDFIRGLRATEARLKQAGHDLIPLDEIVRAICF
jgi:hypothetical protein